MPWFYPILKRKFPAISARTVIAYGAKIHQRTLDPITPDLNVHEHVHLYRQKFSRFWGTIWWMKYIYSPSFRFEEELIAYREQYRFAKANVKDKNMLNRCLVHYASELSSELYGNLCTQQQASELIQK